MKYLMTLATVALIAIGCQSTTPGQITYKDVDVAGAKKMINDNKDLIIIDVRTPEETSQGMIPNAIEIDYKSDAFEGQIAKLDKSKSYLVYCRSGGRSVSASKAMTAAGINDVTNMKGGYNAWK